MNNITTNCQESQSPQNNELLHSKSHQKHSLFTIHYSLLYCPSPLGPIGIVAENDNAVTEVFFTGRGRLNYEYTEEETPLLLETAKQLTEYFAGERHDFDLPLAPSGTPFQMAAWQALCTIPYGETRSYRDMAIAVGNPKACRAIGMANNRNPITIIIPCHRVIGADGSLVGYGSGLENKKFLLTLEQGKLRSQGNRD